MKVRYIGEDRENLKQGETYEVLGVENGWFRLKTGTDEAGEDTAELAPPELCETLMRDWKFDADEIFHGTVP